MKHFAAIMTIGGILLCLFSCDAGKSGPFTFTNSTGESVNVIITQDGTVEKKFTSGEKYTGEDYYSPTITFVKGLDSEENKKITVNGFKATTTNGFDYEFVKAEGTKIIITVNLPADFETNEAALKDCYLGEANGKLSDYSDTSTDFKLTTIAPSTSSSTGTTESTETTSSSPTPAAATTSSTGTTGSTGTGTSKTKESMLYTSNPEFRIYRNKVVDGKTEREDLTGLFSLSAGKSELPPATSTPDVKPTLQWNLEITYPRVEPVE